MKIFNQNNISEKKALENYLKKNISKSDYTNLINNINILSTNITNNPNIFKNNIIYTETSSPETESIIDSEKNKEISNFVAEITQAHNIRIHSSTTSNKLYKYKRDLDDILSKLDNKTYLDKVLNNKTYLVKVLNDNIKIFKKDVNDKIDMLNVDKKYLKYKKKYLNLINRKI